MPNRTLRRTASSLIAVALFVSVLLAQTTDNPQELKRQITELMKQYEYVQALPLLEKIVVLEPSDAEMHMYLGFALLAKTNAPASEDEKRPMRIRARAEFTKAKELGDKHPVVDAMIHSVPPDGAESKLPDFTTNQEAHSLMDQAEVFFAEGKLDEALTNYQKALSLDPKLYEAALFSGDVYAQREDWSQAEVWYQKAIAINPTKERAYRYSATPWMKQRKFEVARDRYIEAYITEPYSKFSQAGLSQWANITKTKLGHPAIEIPGNVKVDENGSVNMTLDPATLLGGKSDGSFAWVVYGGTRALWHKQRFAEVFPDEKRYRHSLNEETDALHSVVKAAAGDKKVQKLSFSLAKLKELDDRGLLEAYILLAKADEGIAEDYPRYLAQNRDKLRRYVVEYVLTNGGR